MRESEIRTMSRTPACPRTIVQLRLWAPPCEKSGLKGCQREPQPESTQASGREWLVTWRSFLGMAIMPHSGMPGPPTGPPFCRSSTESLVTSRSGSSTRAVRSS